MTILNKTITKIVETLEKSTKFLKEEGVNYFHEDENNLIQKTHKYHLQTSKSKIFKNKEDLVNYLVNKIENGETIMVNEGIFSKAAIKRIMKDLALISNEEYQKRLIGMVWGNSVVNASKLNYIIENLAEIAVGDNIKKKFLLNITNIIIDKNNEKIIKGYDEKKWINWIHLSTLKNLNWSDEDIPTLISFLKKIDFDPNKRIYNEKIYEWNIYIKDNFHPSNWMIFEEILEPDSFFNKINKKNEFFEESQTEIDKILISVNGIKQKYPFVGQEVVMLSSVLLKLISLNKEYFNVEKVSVQMGNDRDNISIVYEFDKEQNKKEIKDGVKNIIIEVLGLLDQDLKEKNIKKLTEGNEFYKTYAEHIKKIVLKNSIINSSDWHKSEVKHSKKQKI